MVIAYDGTCTADGVITVQVNPYEWNYAQVSYIAELMGGAGTVVDIYGLDGHPGNIQRLAARDDILAEYPDIEILAETSGGWDQTTAKEAMAQYLASGLQPDAVFTQDSMAYGVLSACLDADFTPKFMIGEPGTAFVRLWKELVDSGADFQACAMPNPPGISGTAMRLAVNLYEGKELVEGAIVEANGADTFYYEVSGFFTNENLDELWEVLKDQPDDYLYSEYITEEALQEYFVG